jgi:preprotein translocase subunit SecF
MEIIRPDTRIDFLGQARVCATASALAVAISIVLMLTRGFVLGIDFAGGTILQVQVPAEVAAVDEGRIRTIVSEAGQPKAVVVRFGADEDRAFLISLPVSEAEQRNLSLGLVQSLSESLGAEIELQRVESVGPRVGAELARKGLIALVLSWVMILIYIWFRFELRYAPGAVIALVHDVLVTAGVLVALGMEFNLQVLAALLVLIGFSINDTIVIYDRIRENVELRGRTHLPDVVNQAVNQTLSRTILTSGTVLLASVSLLLLGGPVIRDFAFPMTIGIFVGTYSTVYVASSLFVFLERRFGESSAAGKRSRKARADAAG